MTYGNEEYTLLQSHLVIFKFLQHMAEKGLGYTIVGGKYILGQLIGKGSFGEVYLATVQGEDNVYAVKREDQSTKHPQLLAEAKILKNFDKSIGFPKIFWVGQENRSSYMAMELLGPSIQDLFCLCGHQFSLKTVIMLADQMIMRIEQLHTMNYIHRDIKPQNFLIGLEENSHVLYLVDYGLSRRYRDPKSHQHIPYKQNKALTGTVRYSSINMHFGFEQSRRDDLESIGYILMYMMNGTLPWQGIKANNKAEKYQKIQEKKLATPIEAQCKGLPIEFSTYLNYCRTLKFQEKPDYRFLRKLFRDLLQKLGLSLDYKYDWCSFKERKQVDNMTMTLIIEKEGDEIPPLQIPIKEQEQIDKIKEEEIQLQVDDSRIGSSISGSQNVPQESMNETDLGLIDRRNSQEGMLKIKNMEQW